MNSFMTMTAVLKLRAQENIPELYQPVSQNLNDKIPGKPILLRDICGFQYISLCVSKLQIYRHLILRGLSNSQSNILPYRY